MRKITTFISYTFIAFCFLGMAGCTSSNEDLSDYKFGAVYSSNEDKSIISTYSNDGKHISDKKINPGGITLASFMSFGIQKDNDVYYPCPVYKNKGNSYILKLDTNNLEVSEIPSEDSITPTFFSLDNNYAYSGSSSIEETSLSKTSLDNNTIESTIQVKGQGLSCVNDDKYLYILSIIHNENSDSYGKISIIDKSTFKEVDSVDVENLSFTSDMILLNNNLYILSTRDGKDNLSSNMIKVGLDTKKIDLISLPFDNLFKIHTQDNYMYVVEANYNGDDTNNRIAKIDLDNLNVTEFIADNKHISSYIKDNQFVSCDGDKVYIYDTNKFNLINSFDIEQFKDHHFVSIYSK